MTRYKIRSVIRERINYSLEHMLPLGLDILQQDATQQNLDVLIKVLTYLECRNKETHDQFAFFIAKQQPFDGLHRGPSFTTYLEHSKAIPTKCLQHVEAWVGMPRSSRAPKINSKKLNTMRRELRTAIFFFPWHTIQSASPLYEIYKQ